MNAEINKAIAYKWLEAFNDHDLESLLLLYDINAYHFSPKLKARQPATNGLIHGKEALRSWWADAFSRLPALKYQLKNLVANDSQVVMEYLRTVPGEPDMMVAEFLVISNGCITSSRVYHA